MQSWLEQNPGAAQPGQPKALPAYLKWQLAALEEKQNQAALQKRQLEVAGAQAAEAGVQQQQQSAWVGARDPRQACAAKSEGSGQAGVRGEDPVAPSAAITASEAPAAAGQQQSKAPGSKKRKRCGVCGPCLHPARHKACTGVPAPPALAQPAARAPGANKRKRCGVCDSCLHPKWKRGCTGARTPPAAPPLLPRAEPAAEEPEAAASALPPTRPVSPEPEAAPAVTEDTQPMGPQQGTGPEQAKPHIATPGLLPPAEALPAAVTEEEEALSKEHQEHHAAAAPSAGAGQAPGPLTPLPAVPGVSPARVARLAAGPEHKRTRCGACATCTLPGSNKRRGRACITLIALRTGRLPESGARETFRQRQGGASSGQRQGAAPPLAAQAAAVKTEKEEEEEEEEEEEPVQCRGARRPAAREHEARPAASEPARQRADTPSGGAAPSSGGHQQLAGREVLVYWAPPQDAWYHGTITDTRADGREVRVLYRDDGASEWLDLSQERHLLVPGPPAAGPSSSGQGEQSGVGSAPRGRAAVGRSVLVYWPGDQAYFEGVVTETQGHGRYVVSYTDGEVRTVALGQLPHYFL